MSRTVSRVLLLAPLAAAGCAEAPSERPGPTLTIAVSPTPATVGPARILLALSDSIGAPVASALVVVTARPPEEGAAVVDTAQEEAPGRYVAAEFPFDAPGEWTLKGSARLADGRRAAARHPIRVVGPPAR